MGNEKKHKESLHPLKAIRIARDETGKNFAAYFSVAPSYICDIENGRREMSLRTIRSGLIQMGIELTSYLELEDLSKDLEGQEISSKKKRYMMIIKAVGIVDPTLKKETEEILNQYYNKGKKDIQRSGMRLVKIQNGRMILE